jgi:hypothetical protein
VLARGFSRVPRGSSRAAGGVVFMRGVVFCRGGERGTKTRGRQAWALAERGGAFIGVRREECAHYSC